MVTNIDDLVVLAVFFGQTPGHRGAAIRVIAGQYLAFIAIVGVSIAFAVLGSTLLPAAALPYFGLIPIALGLRAGWMAWRERRSDPDQAQQMTAAPREGPQSGMSRRSPSPTAATTSASTYRSSPSRPQAPFRFSPQCF